MTTQTRLAIDGNEANSKQRVGSNVYAFELLRAMHDQIAARNMEATILLASPPLNHWPAQTARWRYIVVRPARYWTQWAAPLYLEKHKDEFDLFFTPSHYAPRNCPVPYISSVMDTAYLAYPREFKLRDRIQLAKWTEYSVKHAAKIIVISRFTKRSVCTAYKRAEKDVVVAYPAVTTSKNKSTAAEKTDFFTGKGITTPYFLYVGTIQPRKRLTIMIAAFEELCTQIRASNKSRYRAKKMQPATPQLIIAGKIGWLATSVIQRVAQSAFRDQIKLLGYVSDSEKRMLMQDAKALILIGRHEGFGIPPLEAMAAGTIPIIARTGSLPEVVGQAGMLVAADDVAQLTHKMTIVLEQSARERALWLAKGRDQTKLFSWTNSAEIVFDTIEEVVADRH